MEQVMMMAMQTCQHYSEKMAGGIMLMEYEQQMYESLARMLYKYANLQRKIMKIHSLNAKHAYTEEEKKHQAWLEAQIPKLNPEIKDNES